MKPAVYTLHVEGRTPGPLGKAPMVTLENGKSASLQYDGSHHEAVYLAAIGALVDAALKKQKNLVITSPSEHLIYQMKGTWKVGPELEKLHSILKLMASLFKKVDWDIADRTS